jgi:hypothetical protein
VLVREVVCQFTGGDPLGCAPIALCDVVLEVEAADTPKSARSDLKGAKLPGLDEGPDEAGLVFSSPATCSMVRKRCLAGSAVTRTSYF